MDLPSIIFSKDALTRFDSVIEKEWLITNGLGSYASSTVPGLNTRKYHGLLVAALDPPGNRTVCLAKLDEDIVVGSETLRLGTNEFHDTIYPKGYKLIDQFTINPFPTYNYYLGSVQITKTVFMPGGKNAVVIIYKLKNKTGVPVKVNLYPLLTCRYYHTVVDQTRNPLSFTIKSAGSQFQVVFQNPQASIVCRITDGEFKENLNWVNRIHYRDELMRGEADVDDCFQAGYFEVQVPAGEEKELAVTCAISHENQQAIETLNSLGSSIGDLKEALTQELNHKSDLLSNFYQIHPQVPTTDWLNWILLAADSFMVESEAGKKAVIAGYHWFEAWGRDTFVSLPGFTLVTGRYSDAKNILRSYIEYCENGLIPNFISDKSGTPVYNTVDATLWYVNAVLQYVKYTDDWDFVKVELWDKLQTIVKNHQEGSLFGIRIDEDGLLMHGSRLTWMDAAVGNDVITPRKGKAVEIQALLYNALRIMELLANRFEEPTLSKKYAGIANQTRQSFNEKFWNPKENCLFDVVDGNGSDASIRPNQIFAVSLDYIMLDREKIQKVVGKVDRELATPYGLRTLSFGDPKFVGKCAGDVRSRDNAYHNGTIWPWLLGPYVTAYLKVNNYTTKARQQMMKNFVLPLFTSGIHQGGLGTINEIYDCDPPNEPRGCISQAWSIAEPLRAYVEDILQVKPKSARENLEI